MRVHEARAWIIGPSRRFSILASRINISREQMESSPAVLQSMGHLNGLWEIFCVTGTMTKCKLGEVSAYGMFKCSVLNGQKPIVVVQKCDVVNSLTRGVVPTSQHDENLNSTVLGRAQYFCAFVLRWFISACISVMA